MRDFDLVLFDLDGTLVDSVPDLAWAVDAMLVERGLGPLGPAQVGRLVGEGAHVLVERALAVAAPGGSSSAVVPAAEVEAALARFRQLYRDHLVVATRPYDGVPEMLAALRARPSVPTLAVLTNKPGDMARTLLGTVGLAARFDAIVGDGDGWPRKPDPAAARALMERAGATAARTLLVGDGLPDMELGRALGCTVAAVLWGYEPEAVLRSHGPRHAVSKPSELLGIVS